MAIKVNSLIKVNARDNNGNYYPKAEITYGPYESKVAAVTAITSLYGSASDVPLGVSFGVVANGTLTEYQYKTGEFSASNCVEIGTEAKPIHLKILVLGNSYSLDSFMYLPFILKEYGITCTVGIYYRSGGTLSQLHSGYTSSAQPFYTIDTSSQISWQEQGSKTPQQCVQFAEWDIISLQQASADSLDYDNYQPYVRPIMKLIVADMTKPVKFAWNININRDSSGESSEVQPQILEAIEQVIESEGIDMIFPYGTAVFNARTDETLNALGTKEMWASDLTHLNEGLPCYLAALANVQALFKYFYSHLSVMGDRTRVTSALTTAWAVKGKQGDVIGITEDNCFKAQIAAIQANKYPFEIKSLSSESSEPTKATITLNVSPSGSGTVSGGGSYNIGSTVSISATAASGYTFVKWNDDDTNATRNIVVSSNTTYTAIFEAEQEGGDDDDEPQALTPSKISEGVMYYKGVDTPKAYSAGYYIYYFNVESGQKYNVKINMVKGGDIAKPTGPMGNLICTVDSDDNKISNIQLGDDTQWTWDIDIEIPETATIIAISVKSAEQNDDLVIVTPIVETEE